MLARLSTALIAGFFASPAPARPLGHQARAEAALERLQGERVAVRAVWRGGVPVLVTGLAAPTVGASPAARATHFIEAHPDLFGGARLEVQDVAVEAERSIVRLRQTHGGLRVVEHSVVITLGAAGEVRRVLNDAAPLVEVAPATVDVAAARRAAVVHVLGPQQTAWVVPATKVVFARGARGVEGYLVKVARTPFEAFEVRVDGRSGEVFGVRPLVMR